MISEVDYIGNHRHLVHPFKLLSLCQGIYSRVGHLKYDTRLGSYVIGLDYFNGALAEV